MAKRKRHLNIYGTVFNNAEYIEACISSIKPLAKDRKIALWVVDNYSTDGTIDKLMEMSKNKEYTKYIDFHIYQAKCSRGRGRQIALDYAIRYSYSLKDLAMYIDFDTVYSDKFVETILSASKTIKDNELSIAMLGTVRTQKLAEWKDLNVGEDWERFAHFVSKGVKVLEIITPDGSYGTNRNQDEARQYKREVFYSKSKIRLFKNLIDEHRGVAYKKWKGGGRHLSSIIASYIAHFIAIVLGVYSYSREFDNREMVRKNVAYWNTN